MRKLLTVLLVLLIPASALASPGGDFIESLIYFEEDINEISRKEAADVEDEEELKEIYYGSLKEASDRSQHRVLTFLEEKKALGEVADYESFHIINAVYLRSKEEVLLELVEFPEIRGIERNDGVVLGKGEKTSPFNLSDLGLTLSATSQALWHLESLNAYKAHSDLDIIGRGVVIGFIDSGIDWENPNLRHKWRGYDPETGQIDPEGNWYDLVGDSSLPIDSNSNGSSHPHGTAVVSLALGGEVENPEFVGVAPGAQWIAVRAFGDNDATSVDIIKAAQWMMAPGGDPSRAPDIINNSWGGAASSETWFKGILTSWRDLGIIPVFAAGNVRTPGSVAQPGSIENPANMAEAFAVGAIDGNSMLLPFSKIGPSLIDATIVKPEVVAPGVGIKVANGKGGYKIMDGTSMSAPQISGLFALLIEANPDLTPDMAEDLITRTARPLTDADYPKSPNMGYGYGLPDAYAAINKAFGVSTGYRIAGDNRFATAEEISKNYFNRADTLYITSGHALTDALVMSPLTKGAEGPVLLTNAETLPIETIREVQRIKPTEIVIIGGENSVSLGVESKLRGLGYSVTRIAGSTRYETAVEIGKNVQLVSEANKAYLVNGVKGVDAISISGPAKGEGAPVLLVGEDFLPDEVEKFLMENSINQVTLIGGSATLGLEIEKRLLELDIAYNRIGGDDRYHTSLLINKSKYTSSSDVFVANGTSLVDALSAGPVAGRGDIPLVLVAQDRVPVGVRSYVTSLGASKITTFGGVNSVSQRVMEEMLVH